MNGLLGTDFKDKVLANVVSNEDNVKQVVAKVQLGEADAGIVYTSDAVAAPDLKTIEIPAELNVIAEYPIAPLPPLPIPIWRMHSSIMSFRLMAGHPTKMGFCFRQISFSPIGSRKKSSSATFRIP